VRTTRFCNNLHQVPPTFRKSSDPLIIDFIFSNNNQNNVYLTETIGFILIKTNILLPRAYVTLSCLSSLGYLLSKLLTIIWFSNRSTWSVPDEGYCRNASCALSWYLFLFYHLMLYGSLLFRKVGEKIPVHFNFLSIAVYRVLKS
jgi:hypothetical protein